MALEIIRRTRDAVPAEIPVTVKMRRGIDDSSESRDHFFRILEGAIDAEIAGVTVHGRTVLQRYNGPSRWSFLNEVVQFVAGRMTVLGSGDLYSAHDCLRMIQETGVQGVTAARGAIGNPWIFTHARQLAQGNSEILPPTIHQQREALREHYALAVSWYGPDRASILMRKFGIKYAASHPQWESVRGEFAVARSLDDWHAVLTRWYDQDGPGQFAPSAAHKVQGGGCTGEE